MCHFVSERQEIKAPLRIYAIGICISLYLFNEFVIELQRFWSGLTQHKKAGVLIFACVCES